MITMKKSMKRTTGTAREYYPDENEYTEEAEPYYNEPEDVEE